MRSTHHRTNLRHTAVVHLSRKRTEATQRLNEAEEALRTLRISDPTLTAAYFENKWAEQKARQLDVITETQKQKRERVSVLLGLEEELIESLKRLNDIQSKHRRVRTQADNVALMALPGTVASVEEQIEAMADELGGTEFRGLAGATRNQTTALLALSVAQGKLYEARVGLTEARLRRHRNTGGIPSYVEYNSYCRQVAKYAVDYPNAVQPEMPDLETVMSMPLGDPFWNRGEIPPEEQEAAERDRLGIQSFLSRRSSEEELRRIAREVRQITGWANSYLGRITTLKQRVAAAPVGTNCDRMACICSIVSKKACKLWKRWGVELKRQLQETGTLLENTREMDELLKAGFEKVTQWTEKLWRKMAGIQAEEPDLYEEAEDEEYERLYDLNGEMREMRI
ncbi:uncharacterized protein MELLADRAFT_88562 [Melampsora larici-populina 98AG31]|uniref:Uncharacterized protein n=1 Tax=Melampsora larici-populina (strain 98AG31 / pathotype 3-4-7) TaxID=747676 RepID=F4RS72_MELLP|nr:uncharacterized protein MELLADRAFT_88562 [Melampsora larici-populina 98AG31]EGG04830.1 hypothetical protein MELLADRAFT_88562 [Melampsora larici-populina 98AG31]